MVVDFEEQIIKDLDDIFLKEFSNKAVFKSSTTMKTINIQTFEENLDRLETTTITIWGKYSNFEYIQKNDLIIINDIEYGVVDFAHDEFCHTTTIFIQKV